MQDETYNGGSGDECPCKFIPRIPLSFFLSFFLSSPSQIGLSVKRSVWLATKPSQIRCGRPLRPIRVASASHPHFRVPYGRPRLLVPSNFREGCNLLSWTQNANTLDGWKPLPNGRRTWPGGQRSLADQPRSSGPKGSNSFKNKQPAAGCSLHFTMDFCRPTQLAD